MDLLSKSDEEIFKIGKPFWENLVRASNMKDYGGFTKDFSTQMLFGANEVELGKQWANNKIITNFTTKSALKKSFHKEKSVDPPNPTTCVAMSCSIKPNYFQIVS